MATVTFETNQELHLTTFIVHGDISLTEIERAVTTFYSQGATPNVLWDLSESSLRLLSATDVQALIKFLRKHSYVREKGTTVLVAPKDSDFGLVRMGEVYAETLATSFRVFRSVEEAHKWIRQELNN